MSCNAFTTKMIGPLLIIINIPYQSHQTGNNTKKNLATQTKKQKIHLMVW